MSLQFNSMGARCAFLVLVLAASITLLPRTIVSTIGEEPFIWLLVGTLFACGAYAGVRSFQLAIAGRPYSVLFMFGAVVAFDLGLLLGSTVSGPIQWMTSGMFTEPLVHRPITFGFGGLIGVIILLNALSFFRWEDPEPDKNIHPSVA